MVLSISVMVANEKHKYLPADSTGKYSDSLQTNVIITDQFTWNIRV